VAYRFADGEELTEPLRAIPGGEFRGRLETVNQPFRFTVVGGDDQSSIRDVDVKVVHPPALNQLTVRLVSPKYTGLPTQTLASGLTSFRVLRGTLIELEAQTNKPLAAAQLMVGDEPLKDEVQFNPNRTGFRTSIAAAHNLSFRFSLEDTEGFRNRDPAPHDVRVFKDEAPRVLINDPKTDRDVPTDALIPIKVELDDDYGLHSARLVYRVATGDSEPQAPLVIPLLPAPSEAEGQAPAAYVKHQELAHNWDLAPLKLPVGSVITFYADARDFDTIGGPNVGKSREIRLRIVSREDASRQFDDARRELREEIARVLGMQRQAITPVEEAARTLDQTGQLARKQRDDLNNAGLIQRQVGSRLSDRDEGLDRKLRSMLDDLRNFKIANPEAEQQMQDLRARLDRIRERHQGPAEQGLTRASKGLDQQPDRGENADAKDSPSREAQAAADPSQKPGGENAAEPGSPKAEQGEQGKGQEGPQSKSRQGDQSKGQDGQASSKGQEGQAQGKESEKSPSKDQGGSQERSKDAPSEAAKGSEAAQPPKRPDGAPMELARNALDDAKKNQKAIADELQKMLDGLSEFETYRGVVKDAQGLLKKQEEMIKQTAEAATRPDLTAKAADTLSPEQKAELGNLAGRQSELGKGLENLQERMEEMAKRLEESDPLAASAMREAASKSRQQGTSGKMGQAADQVEKNQMGQARSQQEAARQELRDLVDAVQNRRERELSRLVKELKKGGRPLAQVANREVVACKLTGPQLAVRRGSNFGFRRCPAIWTRHGGSACVRHSKSLRHCSPAAMNSTTPRRAAVHVRQQLAGTDAGE